MLDVVKRTAEACFMPLTVGGGVRTLDDIRNLLLSGADKVSINSAAVANRQFVKQAAEKFGSQCIVVAIDAKEMTPGKFEIFTHGGREPTGIDAVDFAREVKSLGPVKSFSPRWTGTGQALVSTSPSPKPWPMLFPFLSLPQAVWAHWIIWWEGICDGHATAVLAASIFHFGTFTIAEAKAHMVAHGIPMRQMTEA